MWIGWARTVFLTVLGAVVVLYEATLASPQPLILGVGVSCLLGETALQSHRWVGRQKARERDGG